MKGITKRHLSVRVSIPDRGKHAGSVEIAIDPDKVTDADREWARGIAKQMVAHISSRTSPKHGEHAR